MATLVQVLTIIHASESPTGKVLHPGDWIDIKNKNTLRKWIAIGKVDIPYWLKDQAANQIFSTDCGVIIIGGDKSSVKGAVFNTYASALKFTTSKVPALPHLHTLIWHAGFPIIKAQLILGYALINADRKGYDDWDMAAMLQQEDLLIQQIGNKNDIIKTKEIIGDGRLPVYDPRLVFVKRNDRTEKLVELWAQEIADGTQEHHALVRALYLNPVKLCTLPERWLSP
jgi:hypothetical protein